MTGGTGSGKTTALRALGELGAETIDCDALYRRLLADDPRLTAAIGEAFPDTVRSGVLDRKMLGGIVFGDAGELCRLNSITHPAITAEVRRRLEDAARRGRELAAVDAAVLFESGLSELCDEIFFVTAPRETRIKRIMARDGVSYEYASARADAQKPDAYYEKLCGHRLVNDFPDREAFFIYCLDQFKSLQEGKT